MGTNKLSREESISVKEHERDWNEILMVFMTL